MKKIKIILLCVIMAMCAMGVVGCGNDDSNGSSQQTTGAESTKQQSTTAAKETNGHTNSQTQSSGNGIIEDAIDKAETLVDDAATMVDDIIK